MKEINLKKLINDNDYFFEATKAFVSENELSLIAGLLGISFYTLNSYFVSGQNSRTIDWRLKRDIYILMLEMAAKKDGLKINLSLLYLAPDVESISQADLLQEIKGSFVTMTWDQLAELLKVNKRALKNYRMPEHSSNYRTINNRLLRDLVFLKNQLAQSDSNTEMPLSIEDKLMDCESTKHIDVMKKEVTLMKKASK
jgi:hypothetical protein